MVESDGPLICLGHANQRGWMPVPVKGNNGFSSGMTTRNENNSTFIQGVWYLVVYFCKHNFSWKNKSQMNDEVSRARFRFREEKELFWKSNRYTCNSCKFRFNGFLFLFLSVFINASNAKKLCSAFSNQLLTRDRSLLDCTIVTRHCVHRVSRGFVHVWRAWQTKITGSKQGARWYDTENRRAYPLAWNTKPEIQWTRTTYHTSATDDRLTLVKRP